MFQEFVIRIKIQMSVVIIWTMYSIVTDFIHEAASKGLLDGSAEME